MNTARAHTSEDRVLPEEQVKLTSLHPAYNRDEQGKPSALWLDCPTCQVPHRIRIAFRNDSHTVGPKWVMTGRNFVELSIEPAVAGSVHGGTPFDEPCHAHFWIKNGEVITVS